MPQAQRHKPDTAQAASLTEGLIAILRRPVTAADCGRASLHVLDWVGCAVLGAAAPPGVVMQDYGARQPAGPCAAIAVGEVRAETAAFVNGSYGNVLEMDDIHRTSILHPGPVVIPAALACAQAEGVAAHEFLEAMVRGYDAVIRIGASVGLGHYKQFHNTATCGPFGAAAAAGLVLGLDDGRLADALGNAGTTAGGLWQVRHEDAMSKQLHTARAAQSGLVAAMLAAKGFTGPRFILEGPQGFYAGLCPDPNPEIVLAEPAAPWKMYDTSFKPWAACRHAHPVIDAGLVLRDQVEVGEIESLSVRTYADAVAFCDRTHPGTVVESKFSHQHAAAVVLLDGPPNLSSFEPETFNRADIAHLRERVTVATAEPFDSAYPEHYGAEVEATLKDGRTVRAAVTDALGDPANPVDEARVVAKARELMSAAGFVTERIDGIVSACARLATGGTLDALTQHLS